jgi:hypothetical protein
MDDLKQARPNQQPSDQLHGSQGHQNRGPDCDGSQQDQQKSDRKKPKPTLANFLYSMLQWG